MRARQRSWRPGQLFGLSVGKRGATTLAIQRSLSGTRTTGQSVCRALTADSTATRNIQGARGRHQGADIPDVWTIHENIATELVRLRVLKEYELGVRLEEAPDGEPYVPRPHVPAVEK